MLRRSHNPSYLLTMLVTVLRPSVQNGILGKRRRDVVKVDKPEESRAKRHHQRHLTSPPKRKSRFSTKPTVSTQTRYSLRNTADRIRRNIAATLAHGAPLTTAPVPVPSPAPIPIPVAAAAPTPTIFYATNPILAKRQRDSEDDDTPEEPRAKRHHQRHLTSAPQKRKVRPSSKPASVTQTRYSLRMTADRIRRSSAAPPKFSIESSISAPASESGPAPVSTLITPPLPKAAPTPTPTRISDPAPTSHTAPPLFTSALIPASHPPATVLASSSVPSSTHDCTHVHSVPIPITQISNSAPAPIPVCSSTTPPSRCSVERMNSGMTPNPTHLPWDQLPAATQKHLYTEYQNLTTQVWPVPWTFSNAGYPGHCRATGLSSSDEPGGVKTPVVIQKYPEIEKILRKLFLDFTKLYDLYNFRECNSSLVYIPALTGKS